MKNQQIHHENEGKMMKVQMHVRSQKSRGSSAHKFGGPDRYVAVTVAPDDVKVPSTLNQAVLAKRGIKFLYCGQGYSRHAGPRSMLGAAFKKAQALVEELKKEAGK